MTKQKESTKISNQRLDRIDTKILSILEKNGRATYTEISERVNLTKAAVRTRTLRLEEGGYILGYSAILNPAKLGLQLSVFLTILIDTSQKKRVIGKLVSEDGIRIVYESMQRPPKLHVHGLFRDYPEFEKFYWNVIDKIEGIAEMEVEIISKRHKQNWSIPI